ncbi:hypothetical protein [Allopontixanthobacter sp.]|uniref:hypothetical protein n=1 Tax=Allopontixanthobacter sp. TaxID=2906452 RepID=UPI002ABB014E|nr:hypothetical protein [Allopontixanthobacter sp.]MDZ4307125.1 hypothetical protein [Allopontixanthobacter sp.]
MMSAYDPVAANRLSATKHKMRWVFAALSAFSIAGCGETMNTAPKHGTAVFFNFYDEPVQVYFDDELLFDERIDVSIGEESTGFSKDVEVDVRGCAVMRVITSTQTANKKICPERNGFGIWVSPESQTGSIAIVFEPVFTPALD